MSWSFGAVGRPAAVSTRAQQAKETGKCVTPEEGFRQTALSLIAEVTASYPDDSVVQVEANGHQDRGNDEKARNNLSIKISTIYGFVE